MSRGALRGVPFLEGGAPTVTGGRGYWRRNRVSWKEPGIAADGRGFQEGEELASSF